MAAVAPNSQIYEGKQEGMHFMVTYTLRAERVGRWIRMVNKEFLDAAEVKLVGLDCEFTDAPRNCGKGWQKKAPASQLQRAAVLQLSVEHHCLVFQICCANRVPELLQEFLADGDIKFCGAAIHTDIEMLRYYGIDSIPGVMNLQQALPNPTTIHPPSLVGLSNAYLGTNISKNDPTTQEMRRGGWSVFPLSFDRIKYAALDARLPFDLARKHWKLVGYNAQVDPHDVY